MLDVLLKVARVCVCVCVCWVLVLDGKKVVLSLRGCGTLGFFF